MDPLSGPYTIAYSGSDSSLAFWILDLGFGGLDLCETDPPKEWYSRNIRNGKGMEATVGWSGEHPRLLGAP